MGGQEGRGIGRREQMATTQHDFQMSDSAAFAASFEKILANAEKVIEGKQEVIRLALIALVSEGHLLVEDVPGVGKTMLAKALARSTSCVWRRIQFTPDLLPSDVTGVSIYDSQTERFVFRPGAVFANILLGDEINRASPKTQSALLESMEERQVTVDAVTHKLEPPFMVIATQNPLEHEGTYPLPESQLDRFMMRIAIGYPDPENSLRILDNHGTHEPLDSLSAVVEAEGVTAMIEAAKSIHVADSIKRYIVDIVEATRNHPFIHLGASPRAALFLLRAARTRTASEARDFVLPDDIKSLVDPILSHRTLLSADAQIQGATSSEILAEILTNVPIPQRAKSN